MLTRFCQNNAMLVVDEHNVQSNGETIKVSPDDFVTQDKRVDCVLKYDSEGISLRFSTENKICLAFSVYWDKENQYIYHSDS